MWLKSAILFAVLSGGIAAADAAPVYHCDSGSSRVYTSEPQPDCREQAALQGEVFDFYHECGGVQKSRQRGYFT